VGEKDTGILAKAQSSTEIKTITLPASDWVDNQQVVVCDGVSADEAKQNITISPALENESLYQDSRVTCIGFAENQLTFAAESIPAEDLTVYVAIEQTGGNGIASNVYSTEETVVGTWIDGKPLYRISVYGITGAVSSNQVIIPVPSLVNADKVTAVYGTLNDGYGSRYITYKTDLFVSIRASSTLGALVFECVTYWANKEFVYTIEYTKLSDTATIELPSVTALMDAYEEGVNEA
jgi:hypothetical protein